MPYGAVLGRDFLRDHECFIDMEENVLQFKQCRITLSLTSKPWNQMCGRKANEPEDPLAVRAIDNFLVGRKPDDIF